MKKQRRILLKEVAVERLAGEGKGLARVEGKVVFVEDGLPGDVADVLVTQSRKDFASGRIHTLHKASPYRHEAFCQHFGVCGGCKWQHVPYRDQLRFKEDMVREAFRRIAKVSFPEPLPIMGCEDTRHYRNKLEFTFSSAGWLTREEIATGAEIDRRALGFHVPGRYQSVTHVDTCYLMDPRADDIRNGLYRFACENNLEFYDLLEHTGLLRNLLVRKAITEEWMVVVAFARNDEMAIAAVMQYLQAHYPYITSLQYTVNTKRNDAWHDLEVVHYAGADHITEQLGDVRFRISAKSFFQTNTLQAKRLYDVVKDFAGLSGKETVYDLYTGTGSIALYLASAAGHVAGIEQAASAVEDARHNAVLNGISNVAFETGTVESLLDQNFLERHGKPDVVITDPPRAGMHPRVVEVLLQALPERLVYVSCNPSTQARDLQLLSQGYDIVSLQPVDMFPHTWHIENVALLEKRI